MIRQSQIGRQESGFWASESGAHDTAGRDAARHLALRWAVRLRYGLIAGEILLIAALSIGLQISLPAIVLAVAIGLQGASNWLLHAKMHGLGGKAEHVVGALFAVDTLCLTLILGLSGGPQNPFSLLYLVQITFSAVVLRRLWTWSLGFLSTISFGLLFWISRDVPAFQEHTPSPEISPHLLGMWIAFATAALLISFFVGKLSTETRQKESEVRQMQQRLARNERLASLVTLSAGAAHEMATPLATIAVTAKEIEHAAVRLNDAEIREDAQLVRSQVERCRLILERMGAQGADPFGETPKTVELKGLLEQVRERFPADRYRIDLRVADDSPVCVIPVRAAIEALSALVKNALDASPGGERVVMNAARSADGRIRFTVRDQGVGMSPEIIERVAEPFFTTKPAGQGMGLGAFLAHLFAQTLGGQLSFESEAGRGCTATLDLPGVNHGRA
jgi:two-component system sensor histidine kinase RegB